MTQETTITKEFTNGERITDTKSKVPNTIFPTTPAAPVVKFDSCAKAKLTGIKKSIPIRSRAIDLLDKNFLIFLNYFLLYQ